MSGSKALLDSNVIIEAAKGSISLETTVNSYDKIYTSVVCYIEVLGYQFNNQTERETIERILDKIPIIHTDDEIADLTLEFRKKSKIKLPDALILATAEMPDADLVTSNVSDFRNLSNVRIVEPLRL